MDTAHQEDQQLIAGITLGDEAALQKLLRKYSTHLYEFALSIVEHHDFAQEAVSNVFLSLWHRRQTLCISGNVRAYLLAATTKQAVTLRSQVRTNEVPIEEAPPQALIEDASTDHELRYLEFLNTIEVLLKTMPPMRQKVFRMSSFENLRYKEIATALGISVAGVQNHMIRARRQLAAALPALGYRLRRDPGPP